MLGDSLDPLANESRLYWAMNGVSWHNLEFFEAAIYSNPLRAIRSQRSLRVLRLISLGSLHKRWFAVSINFGTRS